MNNARIIAEFVLAGAEPLPAKQRADIFDTLGTILQPHDEEVAKASFNAAHAIREAESAQLLLKEVTAR